MELLRFRSLGARGMLDGLELHKAAVATALIEAVPYPGRV